MTVNVTDITSGPYAGNDVADTFSYDFTVKIKTQLSVYQTSPLGIVTTMILDSDYTVTGVGVEGGGTVVRTAGPLPTGYQWFIVSNYPITQLTDFESQGGFFPDVHESAFDKLTYLILQISRESANSLRLSESYSGNASTILPDPAPNGVLAWDPLGLSVNYVSAAQSAFTFNIPINADPTGVLDSTDSLQDWLNKGGALFAPRGVYYVTRPLYVPPCTRVFGEGSGSGTFNPLPLLDEAAQGATIFICDEDFIGDSLFYSQTDDVTYSIKMHDIKLYMKGSDCHGIRLHKAYDNIVLSDMNIIQLGDNASAIVINGNSNYPSNLVSQTILIQNVLGIHDFDEDTAVAPTFDFDYCQEMNLVGVKAFGGSQSNVPACYPMRITRSRGVQLYGCSFAHSSVGGILIEANGRLTTGIVIDSPTFENLGTYAVRAIGDDLVIAPVNAVSIRNPRFQSPQNECFYGDYTTNCIVDGESRQVYLTSNTSGNVVTTRNLSAVTDLSPSVDNTVIRWGTASDQAVVYLNKIVSRALNTPSFGLRTPNGDEYNIKWSATDSTDFGLVFTNPRTGETFTLTPSGDAQINTANRGVILRNLSDTADYRIRLDEDGNIVSQNLVGSDRKINSDIPNNQTVSSYSLAYSDTGKTVWMTTAGADTVNIPLNATVAFSINTCVMVMQGGAGTTTIQAPVGVTLNGIDNGSCTIAAQYTGATLIKRGTDAWVITGNISTVA